MNRPAMSERTWNWVNSICLVAGIETKLWKALRNALSQSAYHFTWYRGRCPSATCFLIVWKFSRIGCPRSHSLVPFRCEHYSCLALTVRAAITGERTRRALYLSDSAMCRISMYGHSSFSGSVIWMSALGMTARGFLLCFLNSRERCFIFQLSREQAFARWFEKLLDCEWQFFHCVIFTDSKRCSEIRTAVWRNGDHRHWRLSNRCRLLLFLIGCFSVNYVRNSHRILQLSAATFGAH